MENIVEKVVPKHARKRLDEEREVDFSYFVPGIGRFRTNLFQQRGEFCLAMRYVKTQVPSFEELGLLPILRDIADLRDVAACWPISSIEDTALWVVPADDQEAAERFAAERFPNRPYVVMALSEAESIVRQNLEHQRRCRRAS